MEGGAGGRVGRAAVCEEHAAGVSGTTDRAPGAGGALSAESGVGQAAWEVSDQEWRAAEAEGGAGHDEHSGARCGEGHLQPARRWDREASAGAREAERAATDGVGGGAEVRAVR